jgi:hypothetical protein
MSNFNTKKWLIIGIVNLFIVACLGTLMRYKIGFEFPYFNQKNIQHAHSHFAFTAWISHILYVFILNIIHTKIENPRLKLYEWMIAIHLLIGYGMLFSFTANGYNTMSISFSTLSIFVNFVIAGLLFSDFYKIKGNSIFKYWINTALILQIISSLGTFYLAYMLASKTATQDWYLGSIYLYLHFQYNGWFFFAIMGLIMHWFSQQNLKETYNRSIYLMFTFSVIPAFLLSILWVDLPSWVYILVVLAPILQMIGWIYFLKLIVNQINLLKQYFNFISRLLFGLVIFAMSIKLVLQLASTIPAVSQFAFGFRSIVIAYLHLILLCFVSLFLLAYMYGFQMVRHSKLLTFGLLAFAFGIYTNELILLIQGIGSFSYKVIPYSNHGLFGTSVLISVSILIVIISQVFNPKSKT